MPPIEEHDTGYEQSSRSTPTTSRTARQIPVWKRLGAVMAVPVLVVALAACQSNAGISSEDAAAIKDQIEQVAARLDAVEDRLMDLSQATDDAPALLISEVRAATSDVGAAKTMLADVSNQLEASVPEDTVDDAIDQTDDFLDQTIPDVDSNDVDPFLDPAPADELPPVDQTPPVEEAPGLDSGPEAPSDSPFGDDEQ